ncbi:phosphatase PAP2 family protein [Streptomyces sp. OfavH-34-F]|uniref:phosphatase PAP2 family protein n=1 Tax=Streptomyces sp. OfavH-34-F TaxID=2917760 RepID=UPI001EF2F758|nr:phosphatase PAP2 family protein [Streptomyces sp. OfavH-34-F]MCG7528996.1 phosphatase PAP2 family protein [Streptomyces sp. OfavH-34-F]
MRETPRSQGTAGESGPEPSRRRPGRAFAHTAGASRSGTPHRSGGRSSHTPRNARHPGPLVRSGTTPPVPGRTVFLLSLVAGLAALFALTTWQVASDGPLRALDERAGRALTGHGPRGLTEFLADLGNMQVALPVLGCAIGWALLRGRRWEPLGAALAMALVPLLVVPLKEAVARPGPLTEATGYYPSGHAATAAVAYGASALLLAGRGRPAWMMPVIAVLLTAMTGIGLVLRGYHWPLDVLGSWFLCGLLLLLPRAFGRISRSRRRSSSRTASC